MDPNWHMPSWRTRWLIFAVIKVDLDVLSLPWHQALVPTTQPFITLIKKDINGSVSFFCVNPEFLLTNHTDSCDSYKHSILNIATWAWPFTPPGSQHVMKDWNYIILFTDRDDALNRCNSLSTTQQNICHLPILSSRISWLMLFINLASLPLS